MKKIILLLLAVMLFAFFGAGMAQGAIDTWIELDQHDSAMGLDYGPMYFRGDSSDVTYLEYHGHTGSNDPGFSVGLCFGRVGSGYRTADATSWVLNNNANDWDTWDGNAVNAIYNPSASRWYTATFYDSDPLTPIPEPATLLIASVIAGALGVKRKFLK